MLEIYRSSRIEKLADLLAEHLRQQTPASVLAPQTVVVGHLGMKRWLLQRLAEWQPERGRRIAANLDMLLPSEWLDGLALQVLGRQSIAIAPYRRQALRWRIHALLPRIDSPELAHYLEGEDAPRRHFQLADRLAGLFGQYLVYRRDWLAAWERGETAGVPHWQNQLWRRLVADIGLDHRGRRMSELAAKLPALAPDADQPALHVFGVSHLPPDALSALDALSRSRRVAVYFPDPCRELWEHLRSRRAVYAASLRGEAFLEIGHPLLGALGRIGQHFTLLLNGLDAGCDLRHQDDERAQGLLPPGSSLLQRVQHSIRTLQPEWVRRAPGDSGDPRTDASLRVHACHTRLRELEVLKDALLDQLAADPALNPRDIVVMAPNMALYAPLLPVVFGAPARRDSVLPWRLADVALARTHPLLGAVRELLDLPTQRITRSQVLALLALPAVARRFDLDAGGHAALTRWLERAHVAWGLDGEMKRDFGAAPVDEHSFAFGCDRMFAGYLLGEVPADTLLDGSILPARPVTGPDAASLGALWGLLDVLREWRAAMRRRRSLGDWSTLLREWLERLFAVDPRDDGEREALAAVLALAADLASQQADAGVVPEVDWSVVREVLRQGLEGIPERQPFLAGGITFCGMVPQRSIPFEVIALLGLNDGEYPRARPDSGLDLMQSHPRLGDRDNRADDRYLFLEALMSARRTLHLSHVGEGAQDGKPRNPALPLEELLGFLDQHAAVAGHERPWRVRHALQPFDARYFGGEPEDPRWFSYSEEFSRVVATGKGGEWRFLDGTGLQGAPAAASTLELRALAAYFRDPAGWVCRQALKLSRAALEESAPSDDEPLAVSRDRRDRMHIDLCWQALRQGQTQLPLQPPAEFSRSGRYASGKLGEHAWQQTRAQAQAWLDLACSLPPFDGAAPTALAQAVDLELGGVRLIGSVGQVYQRGSSLWLVSISPVASDFRQLLPVFLDWAALRLALPQADLHLRVIHRGKDEVPELGPAPPFATDPGPLRYALERLIALYQDAFRTAAAYHARSSHALAVNLAAGDADKALDASRRAWRGQHESVGERDYAPGYNRMIAGDERFLHPGHAEHARFDQLARELYDLLRGALPEHSRMSAPAELDWRRLALTGTTLIEASAGTGKTWNIALLYLRLVLERELDARQIVVTTFTEAAAQELRARVRGRLADAEAALAAPALPQDELHDYLAGLVERSGRMPLLNRVRLALAEIDLAPITTIHGLCRRILSDFPFDTGMPFALGEIVDTPKLVRECVEDFWRARFLGDEVDPWEAAYALGQGVAGLAAVVRNILGVDEDAIDLEPTSALRAWWASFCARDLAQMRARVDTGEGFARPEVSLLRKQLRTLLHAAATGDPAGVDWDKLRAHLDPAKVQTAGLKKPPQLSTWPTMRLLVESRELFARIPARVRHEVALDCARFVRSEIRRRLLQRGQASFSQLIDEVHARLAGAAGDQLAARLQQSWPVALIDEFQDTDARQWAIFDRVWRGAGPGGRALLLIGDPKQSIYGFRGGDVASYLNVRDALPAQRILSISRNYRSHPRLLLALNALYDRAGTAAFGDSGIDYVAVETGDLARWRGSAIRQPLRLRLMPALSARKGDRDQAALEACVDDIAALLEDRAAGCSPGDVAVLLDSNARIRTLRRMLAARGIPVVGAGRANVLDSEWAEDVQLLLHALLEAGDEYAVRGALATRLLGRTAADLARLAEDVDAWERELGWFAEQHERWRRQGPLAVIEAVLHLHAPRLLAAADGERALTDLRHLGELLQEAAAECYGAQELYAWYVAERARSDGGEEPAKERQLRIESEQQRVQLMTLHASKGLEFRAVFVPMAWRSREPRASAYARYHDAQRRLRLDLGSPRLTEHAAIEALEDLQERLRGLYVGVTRAVQLCTLYAFDDLAPQAHAGPSQRAALDVLLGAALASFGAAAGDPWAALAKALPSLRIEREPRVSQLLLLPPMPQRARRARPQPPARALHGLYSFTALTRVRELALSEASRLAEDEGEDAPTAAAEAPHPELAALAHLRGARFGDAMHGLLEDGRQAQPYAAQPERIRRALDRHSVRSGQAGDDAAAIAAVARLLDRTLESELAPGLSLGGLPPSARRAEFEFAFVLDDARWWRLHGLLDAHGLGHWWPPGGAGEALRGLMKGYIDLVFAFDGRFHVLDYKSNWLGERLADYAADALDQAMVEHHYGLQALIYTVALQRYLARRIPDYQPERHLGESWYLFLRAIGLAPGAGLWRKRFPQGLVDALDALFDGAEDRACA